MWARAAIVVAGGGLGLSACDLIHVRTGVLSYAEPAIAGQAWWVPVQFALATAAICAGAWPFAVRLPEPRGRTIAVAALWFVGAYAASGAFHRWPLALAAAYALVWAGRTALSTRPVLVAAYSLALAVAGTGAEALVSATGGFAYAQPDVLGVPIWLPGLYLLGAPLALALTGRLMALRRAAAGAREVLPRPA